MSLPCNFEPLRTLTETKKATPPTLTSEKAILSQLAGQSTRAYILGWAYRTQGVLYVACNSLVLMCLPGQQGCTSGMTNLAKSSGRPRSICISSALAFSSFSFLTVSLPTWLSLAIGSSRLGISCFFRFLVRLVTTCVAAHRAQSRHCSATLL